MLLLTMIARVSDGLPLAASIEGNEQLGRSLVEYQNQAKQLFKKLTPNSPVRCSLNSNQYTFHYLIDPSIGVIYLTLCEQNFSKKLAFGFLEKLATEFKQKYDPASIYQVKRPYAFVEFDNYINKQRKQYASSLLMGGGEQQIYGTEVGGHNNSILRTRDHLAGINAQLADVQSVMVQNIDDVLRRGETLSMLDDKAAHLSVMSEKYKKNAKSLNSKSLYIKIAIVLIFVVGICLYVRYKLLK